MSNGGGVYKDMMLIIQHMQRTFALRREEIVKSAPPHCRIKGTMAGPANNQEFHRITHQNLPSAFFAALDKHTPPLLRLYKQRKTGAIAEKMAGILAAYEEQDKNDVCAARTAALAGLPVYFKEDSSEVFRTCKEDDLEEYQEGTVALVAVVGEDEEIVAEAVPLKPLYVSVVLEDKVVMTVRSWPDALVVLFGLMYAFHLSYPKKLSIFFDFIQMVFLKLEDGCEQLSSKLQTLKNELELSLVERSRMEGRVLYCGVFWTF